MTLRQWWLYLKMWRLRRKMRRKLIWLRQVLAEIDPPTGDQQ